MPPFVDLFVDAKRFCPPWVLRDNDFRASFVKLFDNPVRIEGLVSDQPAEVDLLNQRGHTRGVEAMPWQQYEAHQITQSIGEGQDLGRYPTFRFTYGLALSPPFAPWPCRWTLTIVASIMAYSISGSSERASNIRLKTSRLTQ